MIKSGLLGMAIGDALGVPVEFTTRDLLKQNPVTGMREFGTHQQPKGTWSDDSSMAFCTAETLLHGYSLSAIANSFINWYDNGHWAAHGKVFDIGGATREAIWQWKQLKKGTPEGSPVLAGGTDAYDNGNGSLMRILPMAFYVKDLSFEERTQIIFDVSSITHAHFRSKLCCLIYTEIAVGLLLGKNKEVAYAQMQHNLNKYLDSIKVDYHEVVLFQRLLQFNIADLEESKIRSSGYVLHTLEASLWCIFNTDNFADAVLKAVNLGEDTDTTGAVTGGLAGLLYGWQNIPVEWLDVLAQADNIAALAEKLQIIMNS